MTPQMINPTTPATIAPHFIHAKNVSAASSSPGGALGTGFGGAGTRIAVIDVGFSGYAVSAGGLTLPVTDQLTSVADLFSDRTTMRAWWRGPADSRVDVVTAAGETGTHRSAAGTWTWNYESATAVRSAPS